MQHQQGRITSYYGPGLQRYISLRAHPANEGRVANLLFHERGVISLASKSVHLTSRRGLTQWHISWVNEIPMMPMILTLSLKKRIYERLAMHELPKQRQLRDPCGRMPKFHVQDRCRERKRYPRGKSKKHYLFVVD